MADRICCCCFRTSVIVCCWAASPSENNFLWAANSSQTLANASGGVASHWATYALVFLGGTSSTSSAHLWATFLIARNVLAGSRSTLRLSSHRRWTSRTFSMSCSRNILSRSSAIPGDVLCRRSTSSTRPWEKSDIVSAICCLRS
ncbi:hypothetical protein NP493_79g08007 [Ridgeia piscesae]|uniref:Uncharacterized protein n=1 Tax=Ridgeia piscesae TaxID=27915 RepID=A0AAD9UI13_RIDPI|nr:hypothetical protein NP493_79g08007 [Ridgeia piscesae]